MTKHKKNKILWNSIILICAGLFIAVIQLFDFNTSSSLIDYLRLFIGLAMFIIGLIQLFYNKQHQSS
jgi:drug/metabolite transporter (DMT)-like permease